VNVKPRKFNRRHVIARLGVLFSVPFLFGKSHAQILKTPNATEGPFYPKPSMRLADTDNDLVKIDGRVTEAGGEIITLKGVVSNKAGTPVKGLRVEIWQCDMNGKYFSPLDRQNITHDIAFQGFGHDITTDKGEYSFRTIKPAKYPGRAEHIHVKVLQDETEILTTQFYVDGQTSNQKDWLYRRLSREEADSVTMKFKDVNGQPEAVVNIVV